MSSPDLCLSWNDHHSSFFSVAESLCQSDQLTDVILSCGTRHFVAHKLILTICSDYFASIFVDLINNNNNGVKTVVYLKDVDPDHLEMLLAFMYRGQVSVDENQLVDLLHTAKGLRIRGLSEEEQQQPSSKATATTKRRVAPSSSASRSKRVKEETRSDPSRVDDEDAANDEENEDANFGCDVSVNDPDTFEGLDAQEDQTRDNDNDNDNDNEADNGLRHLYEEQEVESLPSTDVARLVIGRGVRVCPVCSQHFQRPSDLRRHLRRHTGERPFKCKVCSRALNRKESLKKHCLQVHHMSTEEFFQLYGTGEAGHKN